MADTVTTIVVAALSGGAFGGIAALLTPWAAWGVEKRRETRSHRRQLLDSWRGGVTRLFKSGEPVDVITLRWFQTLRPYLNEEERRTLEGDTPTFVVGSRRDAYTLAILQAVERQEKAWGLD